MTNETESTLTFEVERQTEAGKQDYSSRECRTYYKDSKGGTKPIYSKGYVQDFRRIGSRVAFVAHYQEGMFDQLGVDAVMEVDGGPLLTEPFIFEQSTQNTDGMSLTGIASIDAERNRPDQSMESIMLVSGGPFSGPEKQDSFHTRLPIFH